MSTFGKRLTLAMGVVAGAALAAFAVSRSGRQEIRKWSSKTAGLRDDFLKKVSKDIAQAKKMGKRFI